METNLLDDDELLPDDVLDQLAKELPEGCLYCYVRDGGNLFFADAE